MGLLLLRLTGLNDIDIRLRDTSAIGSLVFEALRLASDISCHRHPNIRRLRFSVDREDRIPVRTIQEHHEEDIFDAYHPVPDILKFQKLEYVSNSLVTVYRLNRSLDSTHRYCDQGETY